MSKIIKIDLDNENDVELLNYSAIARKLKVTPQYAARVFRGKQPGTKLKERLLKFFNPNHRAA